MARYQFKFWLRTDKVSEVSIGHWLDTLRHNRQQKKTIIAALTLYKSLQDNDTSVLVKTFPHLASYVTSHSVSTINTVKHGQDKML